MAVCRLAATRAREPRLVALLPQTEAIDEDGIQVVPPGMQVCSPSSSRSQQPVQLPASLAARLRCCVMLWQRAGSRTPHAPAAPHPVLVCLFTWPPHTAGGVPALDGRPAGPGAGRQLHRAGGERRWGDAEGECWEGRSVPQLSSHGPSAAPHLLLHRCPPSLLPPPRQVEPPDEEQVAAAEALIAQLSLDEGTFHLESIPNPALQRFYEVRRGACGRCPAGPWLQRPLLALPWEPCAVNAAARTLLPRPHTAPSCLTAGARGEGAGGGAAGAGGLAARLHASLLVSAADASTERCRAAVDTEPES